MNSSNPRLVEFLLVEDNDLDAEATMLAAQESMLANRIHHVLDGEQALEFLYQRGEFVEAPRPDMILLDLNLPGIDGREVLEKIKDDPNLKTIPVCILTSSEHDADILRSYELHANAYIKKPFDSEGFTEVVKRIEQFWVGIVVLPPQGGAVHMTAYSSRPAEILMIDDTELDADLLRRAMRQLPLERNFHWVPSGEEGLDYVRRRGDYADAVRPDLILLDLNMPGLTGHEVLRELKADEDLKSIPVVIMTTSELWEDVRDSYDNHCNGFLTKPFDVTDLKDLIGALNNYWFSLVKLPSRSEGAGTRAADRVPVEARGCQVRIMLVEDNPLDAEIMATAARDLGFVHPVEVMDTAEAALAHLRSTSRLPDLVLLDLNLPGTSGQEFLKIMKEDPKFRSIQVVIVTGQDCDASVREAYRTHANSFILKPERAEDLEEVLANIALWHSFIRFAGRIS